MTKIIDTIESFGKYKIIHAIDGGANADAYKARHIHLSKEVFLKVYEFIESESTLFQEPQYLMTATEGEGSSDYIIKIYDAEILDKYILLSTEFIQGKNLLEVIQSSDLGLMDAIEITQKVLLGLSHLHSKYLVHRDLKPANIMLIRREGGWIPKISDFGSAKKINDSSDFVSASRHSALYVPPEGWRNNEYGIVSDLYQIGIVLFEMVNGCLPYDEPSYLDRKGKSDLKNKQCQSLLDLEDFERTNLINECLSRRAYTSKILTLKDHSPVCPFKLKKIIKKATQPSLGDRYESVSGFFGDLSELSYPNWKSNGNSYRALNWKRYDWLLEPPNDGEWSVKRARVNTQSYRRWKTGSIKDVLEAVESF